MRAATRLERIEVALEALRVAEDRETDSRRSLRRCALGLWLNVTDPELHPELALRIGELFRPVSPGLAARIPALATIGRHLDAALDPLDPTDEVRRTRLRALVESARPLADGLTRFLDRLGDDAEAECWRRLFAAALDCETASSSEATQ